MAQCGFPPVPPGIPAVILAAGRGARLQQRDLPKPLTPLLGLSLLERAVLSCRQAGVTACYVVVGYAHHCLTPYIAQLAARYQIPLHAVVNPHWEEGNGTSVLAVRPYVQGPFLLVMGDHLFDPDILRQLCAAAAQSEACLLAVDRRLHAVFDLAEATKVRLEGSTLTAIGKTLASFDAVDTGLFFCRPVLFAALAQARAAGDASLTGGVRQLIGGRQIRAVDIGERFWIDVDTPADLRHAERQLLATLTKPQEDGPVARHLNRPLSRHLSRYLARTPLHPNHLTLLSSLLSLAAAGLLALAPSGGE
ncbi:MAG: hypothetical protein KatS3mg131_1336 [Candidatus Tectimicrobiota bacterium]|nr:MAG: hypothetical protein KatS3mg131_1336 [Candidatus Tectomicrobia bacterium]